MVYDRPVEVLAFTGLLCWQHKDALTDGEGIV